MYRDNEQRDFATSAPNSRASEIAILARRNDFRGGLPT
jgi:hypothetical protein